MINHLGHSLFPDMRLSNPVIANRTPESAEFPAIQAPMPGIASRNATLIVSQALWRPNQELYACSIQ
jgi:hypothetical protein